MPCYIAGFEEILKPASEIEEIKWLEYSNLKVTISSVDKLIFKDLHDNH